MQWSQIVQRQPHYYQVSGYTFSLDYLSKEVTPQKPKEKERMSETSQVSLNNAYILETISATSIKEDEEGTNLNAKGINTDYVKHYNSINKTREEGNILMPFGPPINSEGTDSSSVN